MCNCQLAIAKCRRVTTDDAAGWRSTTQDDDSFAHKKTKSCEFFATHPGAGSISIRYTVDLYKLAFTRHFVDVIAG